MRHRALFLVAGFLAMFILFRPAAAQPAGGTEVDLVLALTVDVSLSMDLDEQRLQRDGYVAAFRDPEIWAAIRSGAGSRIAVAYIEWAGPQTQVTVLPWTLIDTPAASASFADALEAKPISRARMTSISGALRYAEREIERSPYHGRRNVVDVSGDGPNNAGPAVVPVRDELVAKGIVINGLPILLKDGGPNSAFDIPDLDRYYAECVIGGAGSFSIPVHKKDEFAIAIRRKLILEIAGVRPERPARIIRTQATPSEAPGTSDCLIGEKRWQRYRDGGFGFDR